MGEKKPISSVVEKISRDFEKAGASKWDILKIIQRLEAEKMPGKKLRKKAFELLLETNPSAAKVFSSFQKMRVFTSHEKLEAFDRGNITKSLLRETSVPRQVAEKISSEVEDRLKELNVRNLTTALIRDMVAAKLIEFGHLKNYQQYARLGAPAFDIEEKRTRKEKIPKELSRQYNWLFAIPKDAKKMHFREKIKVFAPQDFSTRPFAISVSESEPKDNLSEALVSMQQAVLKNIHSATLSPTILGANFFFAKALDKKPKKEFTLAAQNALEFLSLAYSTKENEFAPVVTVDLFLPQEVDMSKSQADAAIEFACAFAKQYVKTPNPGFVLCAGIDSKYKLKLLENLDGEILVANRANGKNNAFPGGIFSEKDQINQFLALNVPRITEQPEQDSKLDHAVRVAAEVFSEKSKKDFARPGANAIGLHGVCALQEGNEVKLKELKKALTALDGATSVLAFEEKTWKKNPGKTPDENQKKELLKIGIHSLILAKSIEETENLFGLGARACVWSGKK